MCSCRRQVGNLDLISGIYNDIQQGLLDIERPLVQKTLDSILKTLQKALTTLNWNSHKIDDYVQEVMTAVKDLWDVLTTIKGNVKRTQDILKQWEVRRRRARDSMLTRFYLCTLVW